MPDPKTPLRPIIRWAGSKRKLIPTLSRFIPTHERYVEPFAGSACLFFSICPPAALLGDTNLELISMYAEVRDRPDQIAAALSGMPISEKFYYELRSASPKALSHTDRAARFLYLNRFCFNGVYRLNRSGDFNVPRGVRTGSLPSADELRRWSQRLKGVQFHEGDFEACLSSVRTGDFVYLDPPYSKDGARNRGEYGYSSFSTVDLPRLAKSLVQIDAMGASFMLSYRYSKKIVAAFDQWPRKTLLVRRHVSGFISGRAKVREVLFSNRSFQRNA